MQSSVAGQGRSPKVPPDVLLLSAKKAQWIEWLALTQATQVQFALAK